MMLHYEKEFELEKSQGRFLTARQRMAHQRKLASQTQIAKPVQPAEPKFLAQLAKVTADKAKDTAPTLDGLPTNIRQLIFRFAEQNIEESRTDWMAKQTTEYDSLNLVSKQFYHDLQDMHWQHSLVRKNQLPRLLELPFFCGKFGLTRPDRASPLFMKFNSLSLEIPFDTESSTLQSMTLALIALPLKELKLYFTGCDTYGTKTKLGFCGLKATNTAGKLPVNGQDFRRRALLVNTLSRLENLETLVVSNANMPVTCNQVVNNKPDLKRLAIVCDPRTTVTDRWADALNDDSDRMLQLAATGSTAKLQQDKMPALEELELSANSMLMPSRLAREAMHTLKKLTWTVPNMENQSDGLPAWHLNWLSHTAEIFLVGAMNGPLHRLETLRICVQQQIRHPEYNKTDRNDVGELVGGLKRHLKRMVNLRNLELHLTMNDEWTETGIQIVEDLANQLARLYMSEKTVKCQHLRLISSITWGNFGTQVSTIPRLSWPSEENEAGRKDRIRARKELAFLGYEFTVNGIDYRIVETSEDQPLVHDRIRHYAEHQAPFSEDDAASDGDSLAIDEADLEVVDEAILSKRTRNTHRKLMRDNYHNTADVDIELLRLNGRLLDRERNKHLLLPAEAQIHLTPEEEQPVQLGDRPARRFPVIVAASGAGHWMCE